MAASSQTKIKSAAVLIIGNEILSGRTQDANLAFLGMRLSGLGIELMEARIIPDIETAIIQSLNEFRHRYDYVFTTGGIGPTHDDITSSSVANCFQTKLIRHPDAVAAMEKYYSSAGINDARMKMADIPEGAKLILNPVSGAPGFQIENVFVLPGVPLIMQAMFDGITDRLTGGPPILSRNVATNLREGDIATDLGNIQNRYPEINIGSYPYFRAGRLGVNLVLRSVSSDLLDQASDDVLQMIKRLGGKILSTE